MDKKIIGKMRLLINSPEFEKLHDQFTIKKYTENKFKLIYYKFPIKNPAYPQNKKSQEEIEKEKQEKQKQKLINNQLEEFQKEESNLARIKAKVYEYAICNDFEWFGTFTLAKENHNRYDLNNYNKKFGQFIRNNRNRKGSNIKYLNVPEKHQDGAYHMHGLLKGINMNELKLFTLQDKIPEEIKKLIRQGKEIYNWIPYQEKFGWVYLEKVRNKEAISKYITKYIKKNVGLSVTEKNKKSYYCSKGLKKAETIKKGTFPTDLGKALNYSFQNDYVALIDLDLESLNNFLSLL